MVDAQEDEGGEYQAGGEDQEEDVTESKNFLVDGGLAGPCGGDHLVSCVTQTLTFFATECCALLSRATSHWR